MYLKNGDSVLVVGYIGSEKQNKKKNMLLFAAERHRDESRISLVLVVWL